METECTQKTFEFQGLDRRDVVGEFQGAEITSDAGALLLREQEHASGVIRRFAACFMDHRDCSQVEHSVTELVAQRIYGLALGYEDLNDHEELKHDRLLATLVEKTDVTGENRKRARDRITVDPFGKRDRPPWIVTGGERVAPPPILVEHTSVAEIRDARAAQLEQARQRCHVGAQFGHPVDPPAHTLERSPVMRRPEEHDAA